MLIDQEPIRRDAAADCSAAMERLEHARAGWHRFEHKDKPAFARWRAREFGPLLSKARETEERIRERQALIHDVEMEMRRCFQDAHSAYQRVIFRRENPSAPEPEEQAAGHGAGSNGSGAARKLSEFEQEALFQEWVQKSLGTNPDKMDDEAYSTTFEAFKTHMFRSAPPESPPRNTQARPQRERIAPDEEPAQEDEPAPVDIRVKELYRTLVRRLHPDLRADGSAEVSALWHEVQEAYAASDVPQLEILLAVSDIRLNPMNEGTSVSQMRAVVLELERALRALEKSLEEAEREDAWDFARVGPDENLRVRVKRELQTDLANRRARLDLLTRTIEVWAQGPVANRRFAVVARR